MCLPFRALFAWSRAQEGSDWIGDSKRKRTSTFTAHALVPLVNDTIKGSPGESKSNQKSRKKGVVFEAHLSKSMVGCYLDLLSREGSSRLASG